MQNIWIVALGGLVVSLLAIGPKVRGFRPGRGWWIFKGDKIRSTTFFRAEVKLFLPCMILRHVKKPYRCEKRYFVGKIHGHISPSFRGTLLGVSAGCCQRAVVDEARMIRTWMRLTIDQKWSQCMRRIVRYHPVIVTETVRRWKEVPQNCVNPWRCRL
jgi:hypothetical protein